jgi:hypothetical protein
MTNIARYPLAPDVEVPDWGPADLAMRESEWDFLSDDSYVITRTPRPAIHMPPPIRKRYGRRAVGYIAVSLMLMAVFALWWTGTP